MDGSCGTRGYEKIAFMVLAKEPEGKRRLRKKKFCTWEDNIKNDFQETR